MLCSRKKRTVQWCNVNVNMRSVAGRVGLPHLAYGSTKFALEGLSQSMAYELQPLQEKMYKNYSQK
jgi:NAD(P)-dependent dehydrogenase (short-subunit alcohol dehydrogenase family)